MTDVQLGWDTFLVRIWHETTSHAWRGQIMHLPTHTTVYFNTFEQLQSFIASYVSGIQAPATTGQPVANGGETRARASVS